MVLVEVGVLSELLVGASTCCEAAVEASESVATPAALRDSAMDVFEAFVESPEAAAPLVLAVRLLAVLLVAGDWAAPLLLFVFLSTSRCVVVLLALRVLPAFDSAAAFLLPVLFAAAPFVEVPLLAALLAAPFVLAVLFEAAFPAGAFTAAPFDAVFFDVEESPDASVVPVVPEALADVFGFAFRRLEDCIEAAGSVLTARGGEDSASRSTARDASSEVPPEKKTSTGRSLEFESGIKAPNPRPKPRFLRSATTYSSIGNFLGSFSVRQRAA